jgi:hypothetical protein
MIELIALWVAIGFVYALYHGVQEVREKKEWYKERFPWMGEDEIPTTSQYSFIPYILAGPIILLIETISGTWRNLLFFLAKRIYKKPLASREK